MGSQGCLWSPLPLPLLTEVLLSLHAVCTHHTLCTSSSSSCTGMLRRLISISGFRETTTSPSRCSSAGFATLTSMSSRTSLATPSTPSFPGTQAIPLQARAGIYSDGRSKQQINPRLAHPFGAGTRSSASSRTSAPASQASSPATRWAWATSSTPAAAATAAARGTRATARSSWRRPTA